MASDTSGDENAGGEVVPEKVQDEYFEFTHPINRKPQKATLKAEYVQRGWKIDQ